MPLNNRRRFLSLALGAGGLAGLGLTASLRQCGLRCAANGSDVSDPPESLHTARRTSFAMGSRVSLTVLHPSAEVAERAIAAALAELRLVEELMSLYRPDSQISRLNASGVLDSPHGHLVAVLRESAAMSRRTQGAFDVTVQPLWNLYSEARRAGQRADAAAVETARQGVDWRRVEVSSTRIRLHGAGMAVTLNGIAQGFAADRVMAVLRRCGVRHALVDTGEIGTVGDKRAGEPWTVGIQHPRRDDAYLRLAKLAGRCLATSGDYATSFDADRKDHHIFDPHTGRSPTAFSSVSVAARTATEADALSTAVFVLGAEQGLELVRSTAGADALLVLKDGTTLATEGFPGCV